MPTTASYTPLQWRPQLAVGVEAIDEDHRQLIDLINQVQAIFAAGGTMGELTLALEREVLMRLLREWLIHHVIQKDLRLRDYLSLSGQADAPV